MNYYNEIDPYAADWLEARIALGQIPAGVVDRRSIADVQPSELAGYKQCHFFAGIGGWCDALEIAAATDRDGLWTGSCPCQPWSVAGRKQASGDERHLWPELFRLINACRPAIVFGEQVAGSTGLEWLDIACGDLEAASYATGAAVIPANSFGAWHQRERLWWSATNAMRERRTGFEQDNGAPSSPRATLAKPMHSCAGGWNQLAESICSVLPSDGLRLADHRRMLHGFGNAIVPQVAAAWIEAVLETELS